MKKILVYTENHEPGGGNRYLCDFLLALPLTLEVTLWSNPGALFPGDLERLGDRFNRHELPVRTEAGMLKALGRSKLLLPLYLTYSVLIRLPMVRTILVQGRSAKNRRIFRTTIRQGRYDLAIAFNGGFPSALSCLDFLNESKRAGMPTALSVVSMPSPVSYRDRIYRATIRGIDHFIVNCAAIAASLTASRDLPANRFTILYNRVDLPPVVAPIDTKGDSRTPVSFGFIGRMERSKGVFDLVEAFSLSYSAKAPAKLSLYGKICDPAGLGRAIHATPCADAVSIQGPFKGSVYDVLSNIDVLVLPSHREGFPFVILEAMSSGVAVIATEVGGIPEIVEDGTTGLLVPVRNPAELAKAIGRISADHTLLQRLKLAGRAKIEAQFSPDSFGRSVSAFLNKLEEQG